MRISTVWYCFKQGLQNIRRNKIFSLASVGTIAACVFLFSLIYAVVANFQYMVKTAESTLGITVLFEQDLDESQILEICDEISQREEVDHGNYISADEAWESFKKIYFADREELAEGFTENPLINCASYEIFLKDVNMQDDFVTYLEGLAGIRQVNYSAVTVDSFSAFNQIITYVTIGILIILLGVAVFLIANTISLSISVRREEIRIMKLIGSTNFFVRLPFVVEGLVIGIVGAVIPLTAMYYLYDNLVSYIQTNFGILSGLLVFLSNYEVFRVLIPIALILGAGIGFFGSNFSIRRHLRSA